VPPRETLLRARPWLAEFGITRVADVTGLDCVGIPVVAVCRPNSRSVCVAQGKGLTAEAAEASGLMEAIECHHAEHARVPLLLGSQRELGSSHRLIDVSRLPRQSVSAFHPDLRILWTPGVSLATDEHLLIPYEMVHLDFRVPLPAGSGCFLMSSNGLASGNQLSEALSHAICELVERDANTLFHAAGGTQQSARRIDPRTVDDSACRSVLDRFENAGLWVGIWETTTDVVIPSFLATLLDREPNYARPMPPLAGSGCHPRRHIALLRALTEAAQGRLTVIAGSREGMSESVFDAHAAEAAADELRPQLAGAGAGRSFRDTPDVDHSTFEEDLRYELEALARVGLDQVASVNLTQLACGIPVVRVVIPGLEGMSEVRGYVLGARARNEIARRAV
jgi:YcaO-like protein with predicted kinase domain